MRTISIRLPKEMVKTIDNKSKREGRNRSEIIRGDLSKITFDELLSEVYKHRTIFKIKPSNFYCNEEIRDLLKANNHSNYFLGMKIRFNKEIKYFFCGD